MLFRSPHSTSIVAPEDVELEPSALFRSFQRNADAFIPNKAQSERRMREIKETKTIRAPLPTQGRSYRPQYGDALKVEKVDSLYTVDEHREARPHQGGAGCPGRQRAAAGRAAHGPGVREKAKGPKRTSWRSTCCSNLRR